ncbi:MAG: diguanylate cyclase domain-containing protein [Pseudanabaenaceae cyanobacterium]|jgi:PleD family two-component response regulator
MANNLSFDGTESPQPPSGQYIDPSEAHPNGLPLSRNDLSFRDSEQATDFRQLYRRFSLRALIVDHDPERVSQLKALIDQRLYSVSVAETGEAAWQIITDNLESPIDVVIAYHELLDISSLILCQRLKFNPEHSLLQNTYFIALLPTEREQLQQFAIEAGVNDIWYLPWRLSDVALRLEMAWRYTVLQKSIYRANYRAKVHQQLLEAMSLSDPISGLPNRYAMNASLPNLPLGSGNQNQWLGVLRIKLSGLTAIKQEHGGRIYRDTLQAIAGRLQNNCDRRSWLFHDRQHEMLCVTCHNSATEAHTLGHRLVETIHNHPIAVSYRLLLKVTVYIGGSTMFVPNDVMESEAMQVLFEELIREADQGLEYLLAQPTKTADSSGTTTDYHLYLRMAGVNFE